MNCRNWTFWATYKYALKLIEHLNSIRPSHTRSMLLIEADEYDTIIIPSNLDITQGVQLRTNSSKEEYDAFNKELSKIEDFITRTTNGRYKKKQ